MTNEQKRQLAYVLLTKAANIIEYWEESSESRQFEKMGVSAEEAAQQIANWLRGLPGDSWPVNLPLPAQRTK